MDEGYSGQTCGERADPTGADEICLDVAIALAVVIVPEVERSLDDWTGPTWVTGQELVTVLVQETFLAVLALATFLDGLVQDQDCHLQVVVSSF